MNSFDAIMPGRTICLETANHKSSPDLMCSQHGALEGSNMQLLCCLNTLSNATNYFHFMNLEMGILQSDLTYVSVLFCFVFSCLCATSFAAYLSDVPLESLTGSSDKFNCPG